MKFILTLCLLWTSVVFCEKGSLTVVRCDNGKNKFLSSPQAMQFEELHKNLNPNLDTVVLIHGFNNTYNSAVDTYKEVYPVASKSGRFNYVGFCWPVNFSIDFGKAVKHANEAGDYLTHTLTTISTLHNGDRKVHVIAHSLGCRVLLSSLKDNSSRYINWGDCHFFAPAVQHDVFHKSFSGANEIARNNFVYFSKDDLVLKYMYALWYWLFGRGESWQELSGAENFIPLSLEEKLQYMRNLENSIARSEFDRELMQQIKRAQAAMGLVGADAIDNVGNTDSRDFVSGHSYWQSKEALRIAVERILSGKAFFAREVVNKKVAYDAAAGKTIWKVPGKNGFFWGSGMSVDADGAPKAYHREKGKGLDYLANAGYPGNWWGIVTKNGVPVVQKSSDPAPGYYVSQTAMFSSAKSIYDPRRYVNASTIPYFVLPARKSMGAKLGDIAAVVNTRSGKVAYAMYSDVGPKNHIGEGSIALAEDLGIHSSPKKGGVSSGVVFIVFPGSGQGNGKLRTREEIRATGQRLFSAWGGVEQLNAVWKK
ncbi:alpha/beta hydrolase [Candidatus Uabimicrobium amorphum]|uniref:Alpha/beta hydrolase n=1 Tax=Uabimicrobium amorphum TaxID=2596890 RepID=A0A5S9IKV2_UABAM|nr:alpha/beta hydrolase [Candidatus Uabimicrobium amorphum]BBM83306.1 hypothetical protein UABAM_01657 [Candidatus Uabimicrobium amorphum]